MEQVREANHSFTPNNMNQYSLIDGTRQPTYDNSGNMTDDGNGRTCAFDSENRLMTGSKGSTTWEYDYDPFGRRVLKDIDEGEEVTRYVYDGPHCIAEYNGQGALLRKYIYGPGIDEPLVMKDVDGATVDDYYYHRDALGNVMALSDFGGCIEEGYTYSAFGMAIVNTSPGPDGDPLTPDGMTRREKGDILLFTILLFDNYISELISWPYKKAGYKRSVLKISPPFRVNETGSGTHLNRQSPVLK